MGFSETCLFYLVIGLAVAVAVWTRWPQTGSRSARGWNAVAAVLFWPVYLPILLVPTEEIPEEALPAETGQTPVHFYRIETVKHELQEALAFVSRKARSPFHDDAGRFDELFTAWEAQARRIGQLDRILSTSQAELPASIPADHSEPAQRFETARRQNLAQLATVREQAERDLVLSLTRVRELISAIYVAELTGSMETRAEELIQEIEDSLDGMFQVAGWQGGEEIRGQHPGGSHCF